MVPRSSSVENPPLDVLWANSAGLLCLGEADSTGPPGAPACLPRAYPFLLKERPMFSFAKTQSVIPVLGDMNRRFSPPISFRISCALKIPPLFLARDGAYFPPPYAFLRFSAFVLFLQGAEVRMLPFLRPTSGFMLSSSLRS